MAQRFDSCDRKGRDSLSGSRLKCEMHRRIHNLLIWSGGLCDLQKQKRTTPPAPLPQRRMAPPPPPPPPRPLPSSFFPSQGAHPFQPQVNPGGGAKKPGPVEGAGRRRKKGGVF